MRLHHVHDVLARNYNNLNIESSRVSESDQDTYTIDNAQTVLSSLRVIQELGIIKYINDFKEKYSTFYSWSEIVYIGTYDTIHSIIADIEFIQDQIFSLIESFKTFLPKEKGYVISVKLPEYDSLKYLPKFYRHLDLTLTPLVEYFSSDDILKIHSFENGSKWNEYLVENERTFKILALFLTTAITVCVGITDIQKNKLEMQKMQQSIEEYDKDNDFKEKFDKLFEQREEDLYDKHVNDFIETAGYKEVEINLKGKNHEEIKTVIKQSYKSYVHLANDGTEFYGHVNGEFENSEETNILIECLNNNQKELNSYRETKFFEKRTIKSLDQSSTVSEELDNKDTIQDSE